MGITYLKRGIFYSALMAFVVSWIFFYNHSSWRAEVMVQNVSFYNGSGVADDTSLRLLLDSDSFNQAVKKRIDNSKFKSARSQKTLKSMGFDFMISRNNSVTRVQITSRSRDEAIELIKVLSHEFVLIQNELYSNTNNQALENSLSDVVNKPARLVYAPVIESTYEISEGIKLFFSVWLLGLLFTYCLYFYKNK